MVRAANRVSMNGRNQVGGDYIIPLPGIIFKSKSGSRSSGTPEKPGKRQSRGDKSREGGIGCERF